MVSLFGQKVANASATAIFAPLLNWVLIGGIRSTLIAEITNFFLQIFQILCCFFGESDRLIDERSRNTVAVLVVSRHVIHFILLLSTADRTVSSLELINDNYPKLFAINYVSSLRLSLRRSVVWWARRRRVAIRLF